MFDFMKTTNFTTISDYDLNFYMIALFVKANQANTVL